MVTVRRTAVAGKFYPEQAQDLHATIRGYLQAAERKSTTPKALIVPHAGYMYSGPVAASGYAQLERIRERIRRVVLLGPAHFVPVRGLAACTADTFETPLGPVPVDTELLEQVLTLPQVQVLDAAHAPEHSLEVHVPFLQEVLGEFKLVPLLVGEATAEDVAEVVERLWDGPETLFVVSSDLSHFHDYETAKRIDGETSRLIEEMRFEELRGERACGYLPISGLLSVARRYGMTVTRMDLRNSGDTAGPRNRVVGYAAYVVE